jgi:hypothetical protein
MKKILFATGLASLLSSAAFAENIGVSMALFDDNFLTVLRNGMIKFHIDVSRFVIAGQDCLGGINHLNMGRQFQVSGGEGAFAFDLQANGSWFILLEAEAQTFQIQNDRRHILPNIRDGRELVFNAGYLDFGHGGPLGPTQEGAANGIA